jgi:spore maturation protein SpmA
LTSPSLSGSLPSGNRRLTLVWGVPVLNWIWLGLILASIVYASFTGHMADLSLALFEGSKDAIQLVIGLLGGMVFMLGIMRVAFDGGLRDWIARALAPLMRHLFPEVPADHPAMGAMVMNLASNILGLGNAATPFGIKAMSELSKLNRGRSSASDAMVLFLAINTSAITLLPPSGTMAVRAAANSQSPEAIWIPTLIATSCSTLAAVAMFYLLRRLPMFRPQLEAGAPPLEDGFEDGPEPTGADDDLLPSRTAKGPIELWRWIILATVIGALAWAMVGYEGPRLVAELGAVDGVMKLLQTWSFPLLIAGLLLIGIAGRINVYDSMIEGAKEGLEVAVRIVPYLVAIIAAVAIFRASGLLDLMIWAASPITSAVGVPAEVLPMAILRPLSGSGSFAVMSETLTAYGPDSFIGYLASTLQGSTETTFYVLAVYFGAARITQGRHTLAACLTGDLAGFVGAVAACHLFFG